MASRSKPASPSSHPQDLEKSLEAAVKRLKEAGRDAHHADSIRAHWELGQLLEVLRTGEASTGRMGSILLARKLGLKTTQIKMAGYIYHAYKKPAALDRLLELRRADGSPLRISVVARLCLPRLDGERESLLRRACDENWSETHVKELLGARRKSDPNPHKIGGIPKPPSCLSEALARWNRRADETIRYADTIFHKEAITRLLEAADPNPVKIDQVKALRDRLKEVQKAITAELKALGRIVEHLEQAREENPAPASPTTKSGRGSTRGQKPKR